MQYVNTRFMSDVMFSLVSLVFEIIRQMKAQGTEFFVMACVA